MAVQTLHTADFSLDLSETDVESIGHPKVQEYISFERAGETPDGQTPMLASALLGVKKMDAGKHAGKDVACPETGPRLSGNEPLPM